MTRIGLIARADNRGLGIQTWEFAQHMNPAKTLVLDVPSEQPLPFRNRFPNAVTVQGWPEPGNFATFLQGLDSVYTAETPYHHSLFSIAEQWGVRTVLHVNPEFLDHLDHPELPKPTVFACPTSWMFDLIPQPKTLLPFPVATERFQPNTATEAKNFLHIVGRPAIHDRNGTEDLLEALQYISSDITLTICCQQQGYVEQLIADMPRLGKKFPTDNVRLVVRSRDCENYWDNYTGQEVLVQPRRFGGLCLPMQEALAAGMPAIMPDVSPNRDRLPDSWLVSAKEYGSFEVRGQPITIFRTDPAELASIIDGFASSRALYMEAKDTASTIAKVFSWENLKPRYDEVMGA